MRVIDEKLLKEFRTVGRCDWCGKHAGRDPHHLFTRGMGSGGRLDVRINLATLCRACHNRVHAGQIMRADLLAIVAQREGWLQDEITEAIHLLRRTRHANDRETACCQNGQPLAPDQWNRVLRALARPAPRRCAAGIAAAKNQRGVLRRGS